MLNNTISLRQFIDKRDEFPNIKIHTFCRLMKKVSEALEKEERNIVKINLDEIRINVITGDIVFPEILFYDNLDLTKTIAGFNTGISLVADRKSTKEHKRVSLALMVLGWYCNEDGSAITSDIEVLENFDKYMKQVPEWLQDFFIGVFRKMDYETSFSDYYKKNFYGKIKEEINEAFKIYDLPEEQMKKITKLVLLKADNMVLRGEGNETT